MQEGYLCCNLCIINVDFLVFKLLISSRIKHKARSKKKALASTGETQGYNWTQEKMNVGRV